MLTPAFFVQDNELFIDVNALDINKKQVKPISQQEENESRRLWKEVTAGLKFNDIDKATNAKQMLEQKQRDEAKERKDTGVEWKTRVQKHRVSLTALTDFISSCSKNIQKTVGCTSGR